MQSFATVNNLVSNSQLAINKLRAFIPTYHTLSGIVRNVPLEEETIKSNIEALYRWKFTIWIAGCVLVNTFLHALSVWSLLDKFVTDLLLYMACAMK